MRYLEPHEIEIRVGSTSRDKPKGMLLLYKNARVDMDILDETFGSENWQSKYERIGDILYCSIGVYCKENKTWVWKQSNGIESQGTGADDPNNSKGEASDSLKRAGFMWGIGRELYKWKGIWIDYDKVKDKYENYVVDEISYTEKGEPQNLIIKNSKGKVVYKLENGYYKKVSDKDNTKQPQQEKIEPQAENEPLNDNDIDERIEKDIINDIRVNNREIWNDLLFEGVKVLGRITKYDQADLKGIANDYLKLFVNKRIKKDLTTVEFSKKEKAPELKGWEVLIVDTTFINMFRKHIEELEKDADLF